MKKQYILILLFLSIPFIISAQRCKDIYQSLLHKPIIQLTMAEVRVTMLKRLNELRAEENRLHPEWKEKLKPLLYSKKLEEVCFYYIAHKDTNKIFDKNQPNGLDKWIHWDNDTLGPHDRFVKLKVPLIIVVKYEKQGHGGELVSIGENIATIDGNIYQICKAWKQSPIHWKCIISHDLTHVGFGFRKDFPLIINDFAKMKIQ